MAHHALLARQGSSKVDPILALPNSASTGSSTPPTPTLTPTPTSAPPSTPSSTSQQSSTSSVQSTTSSLPPDVKTSITSDSTAASASTSASTSEASSTTITSSITLSTTLSTSFVPVPATTSIPTNPAVDTNQLVPTSSFGYLTPSVGATVSASAVASSASDLSAGSIVGAVAGTLIGLAFLGFLIAFLLRRYRRSRRRAMRDEDFGTFRGSALVTPRSSAANPTMPNMTQTDHNAVPSLNEPRIAAIKPPSEAVKAATARAATAAAVASTTVASGGGLQERPKYVYGQDPSHVYPQRQQDDVASDAHGGAYSSEPQVQTTYDPEAYGSYARYEDVGNGVVGGVPAGTATYQDAQRAYQGQQGHDQSHYNQSQYTGYYDQQQPYTSYEYLQPHQGHPMGSSLAGAGAHTDDAYGGM